MKLPEYVESFKIEVIAKCQYCKKDVIFNSNSPYCIENQDYGYIMGKFKTITLFCSECKKYFDVIL